MPRLAVRFHLQFIAYIDIHKLFKFKHFNPCDSWIMLIDCVWISEVIDRVVLAAIDFFQKLGWKVLLPISLSSPRLGAVIHGLINLTLPTCTLPFFPLSRCYFSLHWHLSSLRLLGEFSKSPSKLPAQISH